MSYWLDADVVVKDRSFDADVAPKIIWILDLWIIFGFWGHPEIGTAIIKCFEHLEDEKTYFGSRSIVSLTIRCMLNHPLCPYPSIVSLTIRCVLAGNVNLVLCVLNHFQSATLSMSILPRTTKKIDKKLTFLHFPVLSLIHI